MIVGLEGELGAGKTTFVQQLAQALGVPEAVISPTFIYHQAYPLPTPVQSIVRLHHVDLYRLNGDEAVQTLDLEVFDPEGVVCIEWLSHAPKLARSAQYLLRFESEASGDRWLQIDRRIL